MGQIDIIVDYATSTSTRKLVLLTNSCLRREVSGIFHATTEKGISLLTWKPKKFCESGINTAAKAKQLVRKGFLNNENKYNCDIY